jgi:hypothetical protein
MFATNARIPFPDEPTFPKGYGIHANSREMAVRALLSMRLVAMIFRTLGVLAGVSS